MVQFYGSEMTMKVRGGDLTKASANESQVPSCFKEKWQQQNPVWLEK